MTCRRRRVAALLFACAVAQSSVVAGPSAVAAGLPPAQLPSGHCSETSPALRLAGPATVRAGGRPAELIATYRCSGEPAAGAQLYAEGTRGHLAFDAAGHALVQFAGDGAGVARLVARSQGERSNTLVITIRN